MEPWAPEDQGMRSLCKRWEDLWVPVPIPALRDQCEPVVGPAAA